MPHKKIELFNEIKTHSPGRLTSRSRQGQLHIQTSIHLSLLPIIQRTHIDTTWETLPQTTTLHQRKCIQSLNKLSGSKTRALTCRRIRTSYATTPYQTTTTTASRRPRALWRAHRTSYRHPRRNPTSPSRKIWSYRKR